jgi:thiol-disulfide isomerase/thioredoxin
MKKTMILSVMAMLWPIACKDKITRSKEKSQKVKSMVLLALFYFINGQLQAQEIKPLSLLQKIPADIWNMQHQIVVEDSTSTISLKDYHGKLIILDFWATWCTTCLQKMPALAALQTQFNNELKIILVNSIKSDTKEKVQAKLGKQILQSIINDSTLNQLFPHAYIPHYVWIDTKGRLIAYTNADFVNAKQIADVLYQEFKKLP